MKTCKKCETCATKKWYTGPICEKCYRKEWYERNKNNKHQKQRKKQYYERNKGQILEREKKYKKIYNQENKERIQENKRLWWLKNKDRLRESRAAYLKQYCRNRYKNDPMFKLQKNLRSRLNRAIRNDQKSGSAIQTLGCPIAEFKTYIESLWQDGMTWNNYGLKGWHIDHIIPLCKFNLSKTEELKKACHYSNLQPLWAEDNLHKSGK